MTGALEDVLWLAWAVFVVAVLSALIVESLYGRHLVGVPVLYMAAAVAAYVVVIGLIISPLSSYY